MLIPISIFISLPNPFRYPFWSQIHFDIHIHFNIQNPNHHHPLGEKLPRARRQSSHAVTAKLLSTGVFWCLHLFVYLYTGDNRAIDLQKDSWYAFSRIPKYLTQSMRLGYRVWCNCVKGSKSHAWRVASPVSLSACVISNPVHEEGTPNTIKIASRYYHASTEILYSRANSKDQMFDNRQLVDWKEGDFGLSFIHSFIPWRLGSPGWCCYLCVCDRESLPFALRWRVGGMDESLLTMGRKGIVVCASLPLNEGQLWWVNVYQSKG